MKFDVRQLPMFIAACLVILGLVWLLYQNQQELDVLRQLQALQAEQPAQPTPDTPDKEEAPPPVIAPHTEAIKALEGETGLNLSRLAKLIIRDEGDRSRPYLDGGGVPTVGVGRNLKGNGLSIAELHAIAGEVDYKLLLSKSRVQNGRVYIESLSLANQVFVKPLTEADIQLLLTDDLKNVISEAKRVFPKAWKQLNAARKEVVIDVLFNLGLTRFRTFEHFIGAVKRQDWKSAGDELLKSVAARENPGRYFRNYHVMVTGDDAHFGLR